MSELGQKITAIHFKLSILNKYIEAVGYKQIVSLFTGIVTGENKNFFTTNPHLRTVKSKV